MFTGTVQIFMCSPLITKNAKFHVTKKLLYGGCGLWKIIHGISSHSVVAVVAEVNACLLDFASKFYTKKKVFTGNLSIWRT